MKGYNLENYGVPPDVDVDNTPEDFVAGRDAQLEKAVQVMRDELQQRKGNEVKRASGGELRIDIARAMDREALHVAAILIRNPYIAQVAERHFAIVIAGMAQQFAIAPGGHEHQQSKHMLFHGNLHTVRGLEFDLCEAGERIALQEVPRAQKYMQTELVWPEALLFFTARFPPATPLICTTLRRIGKAKASPGVDGSIASLATRRFLRYSAPCSVVARRGAFVVRGTPVRIVADGRR